MSVTIAGNGSLLVARPRISRQWWQFEPGFEGIVHMNNEQGAAGIGHNSGWGASTIEVDTSHMPKFEVKYEGQSEFEEPEAFRLRRNAEIETWLKHKQGAEAAVQLERDSRAKVSAMLFPTPKKGTQRYDIGSGFKVKLQHVVTYYLGDKDKEDNNGNKITIESQVQAVEAVIVEKLDDVGAQMLKRLIRWKPELSGSEYEKLDVSNEAEAFAKAEIAKILTIKPGSPQLAFEEPKAS
jgi:plasmid stabilization system protein ParE